MKAHRVTTGAAAAPSASTNPEIESYYRWDEPDSNLTVLLKPEAVDGLQTAALAGLDHRAHSGDEVGGILLGWTEHKGCRTLIVVEEFEPVFCDHCNGPSYLLSGEDAAIFEAAITWASCRSRQAVGYWRSHMRRGLFLSPDDLALIERHFPNPENVFLLLKPLPNGACTAGFFFWKDDRIQAEFTGSEVPLIPVAIPPAAGEEPQIAPPASTAPPVEIRPLLAPTARSTGPGLRRIAGYVFTSVALAAAAAVLVHRPPRRAAQFVVPKVPLVAERAPTRPSSQTEQAVPMPLQAPKPDLRAVASHSVPIPEPTAKSTSKAGKPFLLPSPHSLAAPAEPPADFESPVAVAAPILATVPAMSEFVVESPGAPPAPRANPINTSAVNPPAPAAPHTFTAPQVIHQVTPAVPRGVGSQITPNVQVDVEVTIDSQGKVTAARIQSTKGAAAELLTIEALKAAQSFRFRPAYENGRAVAAVTILTFRFQPPSNH